LRGTGYLATPPSKNCWHVQPRSTTILRLLSQQHDGTWEFESQFRLLKPSCWPQHVTETRQIMLHDKLMSTDRVAQKRTGIFENREIVLQEKNVLQENRFF
jgi:mRNA degradation ribonuclease J1/J2